METITHTTTGPQTIKSDAADHIAAIDQAAAGQTANIREVRDNTGQVLIKVDAHGNIVPVALDPPVAPALGAATAGDITGVGFQWACTLVNAQGETTVGAPTLATDLTAQQQPLTMPASAPDGCTLNLYRLQPGDPIWWQVTAGLSPGAVYVDDSLYATFSVQAPGSNTTAPSFMARTLVVAGAVSAGDASATLLETDSVFHGQLQAVDTVANNANGASPLIVVQQAGLAGDTGNSALAILRTAALNGHQFTSAALHILDVSGTTADLQQWEGASSVLARINSVGGLGLFGHTAPAAPRTLAQSVIDAITDANAKTAMQACANALSDMGILTLT